MYPKLLSHLSSTPIFLFEALYVIQNKLSQYILDIARHEQDSQS